MKGVNQSKPKKIMILSSTRTQGIVGEHLARKKIKYKKETLIIVEKIWDGTTNHDFIIYLNQI